jgi:AbrB family looped-hinge helix DNA binding protein
VSAVKVSSKFQVVIPKEVREKLEIKAGQKLQLIQYLDRIEFIPQKNIKEMKGFLKGIDTRVPRERDRI